MMAPMARSPNTSGITFTTMVSEAAKPAPKTTSEASSAALDGSHSSATSATISSTYAAPMVARVPTRSDTNPAVSRPATEPIP